MGQFHNGDTVGILLFVNSITLAHVNVSISYYYKRYSSISPNKSERVWDFPGGPVVKTLRFQCRGPGFEPWLGN